MFEADHGSSEKRMEDCLESNDLLKVITPNGSVLYMKPKGKMTALCVTRGDGDPFLPGTFYSPSGSGEESTRGFFKTHFGLEGDGDQIVDRVIPDFTGQWVEMRAKKKDFNVDEFRMRAEASFILSPYLDQSDLRDRLKTFEEDALHAIHRYIGHLLNDQRYSGMQEFEKVENPIVREMLDQWSSTNLDDERLLTEAFEGDHQFQEILDRREILSSYIEINEALSQKLNETGSDMQNPPIDIYERVIELHDLINETIQNVDYKKDPNMSFNERSYSEIRPIETQSDYGLTLSRVIDSKKGFFSYLPEVDDPDINEDSPLNP